MTKNLEIKANTRRTNSNALREYKQTITLNNTQREETLRALGTLLGDACIPIDKRRPGLRVQFIQTIARGAKGDMASIRNFPRFSSQSLASSWGWNP